MQYNVSVNQKSLIEISDDLDIIDGTIFDFISKFMGSDSIEKILVDGKIYYWISYNKIINELPCLGLKSKSAVYKRIDKLIKAGLLTRYSNNQENSKTYIGAGNMYNAYFWKDTSINKSRGANDLNHDPPNDLNHDNHYTSIDHSTNYQEKSRQKENPDSDAQSELPENGKKEKEENQSLNINHENSDTGKEIDLFGNKIEASKSNITSLKEDYMRIFNKITKSYRENARGIKKIDRKTEKNLKELNEYTWEEIEHSINQMYLSDFHKENNYKYLTPEFCSRVDKINRYINENKKSKVKNEKFYTGFGEPIINRNKAK